MLRIAFLFLLLMIGIPSRAFACMDGEMLLFFVGYLAPFVFFFSSAYVQRPPFTSELGDTVLMLLAAPIALVAAAANLAATGMGGPEWHCRFGYSLSSMIAFHILIPVSFALAAIGIYTRFAGLKLRFVVLWVILAIWGVCLMTLASFYAADLLMRSSVPGLVRTIHYGGVFGICVGVISVPMLERLGKRHYTIVYLGFGYAVVGCLISVFFKLFHS